MAQFYRYSIIRFRPYAETGEFANIGVIAFNLETEKATFQLAHKRFARIGHFFDPIAHSAYSQAIENLRVELPRLIEFVPEVLNKTAHEQFTNLFGSRESSILFSSPRVIKSNLELDDTVNKLYDRFVRRAFDKSHDQEFLLTKSIRRTLHNVGINHFKSMTVADDIVPVRFPLAHKSDVVSAIKPLAFNQKNPMHVLDYGAHWHKRLSYHIDKGTISDQSVFLVVEGPSDYDDGLHTEAFELAVKELRKLPFEISRVEKNLNSIRSNLMSFVERHPPGQRRLVH